MQCGAYIYHTYSAKKHERSRSPVNYGLPIVYGNPYCNDAKEEVGAITTPKLNRG